MGKSPFFLEPENSTRGHNGPDHGRLLVQSANATNCDCCTLTDQSTSSSGDWKNNSDNGKSRQKKDEALLRHEQNGSRIKSTQLEDTETALQAEPLLASLAADGKSNEPTRDNSTANNIPIEHKQLVVIGGGPHALTLVLRLLEPDADFMTDPERHLQADYKHRMRPLPQVRQHVRQILQHSKQHKKKTSQKTSEKKAKRSSDYKKTKSKKRASQEPDAMENHHVDHDDSCPPPLTLDFVKEHVLIVDGSLAQQQQKQEKQQQEEPTTAETTSTTTTNNTPQNTGSSLHSWMSGWKTNFDQLGIAQLRSPISAHSDPLDHRTLEIYAMLTGQDHALVPLRHVPKKTGRWDYHGPYNAPTTELFHEFHSNLIRAYGIQDLVQPAWVTDVSCRQRASHEDEPMFTVTLTSPDGVVRRIVETPRVVCAVGPVYKKQQQQQQQLVAPQQPPPNSTTSSWQDTIPKGCLLLPHEIVPYLQQTQEADKDSNNTSMSEEEQRPTKSVLIVGGGATSGHLALMLARHQRGWCKHVTLIQRNPVQDRQFDLPDEWMGPGRAKLLQSFWAMEPEQRAKALKETRGGGSIHHEVIAELQESSRVEWLQDTEILDAWCVDEEEEDHDGRGEPSKDKVVVALSNGEERRVDMIWMATGFANRLENYSFLKSVSDQLPVPKVQGLPVLNRNLSWGKNNNDDDHDDDEPEWKTKARQRLFCMGPLAGLELGPDALNFMGARQGAVRVALALRSDLAREAKSSSQ